MLTRAWTFVAGAGFLWLVPALSIGGQAPAATASRHWDASLAAAYLDKRMEWWTTWPTAARDHDTFCVSCHTALPYALARPALGAGQAQSPRVTVEQRLVDNVAKRVRLWREVAPFYPDKQPGDTKTAESRGTESVLNALVLTATAAAAREPLPDAKLALDQMWAEQLTEGPAEGAWTWLQFHNAPWEGDSQYFGATLGAIAAGTAGQTGLPPDGVRRLRAYLTRERDTQTLMNRVMLAWASARLPGLLRDDERRRILDEALARQQPDGGFTLSSLVGDWKRRDGTPLESKSDGYATGLVSYVLVETGWPTTEPHLARALNWLATNQDPVEGRWFAYSLNKQRDLSSDIGKFMSDAATAFAVLALTRAGF